MKTTNKDKPKAPSKSLGKGKGYSVKTKADGSKVYIVQTRHKGIVDHIGTFDSEKEARDQYLAAIKRIEESYHSGLKWVN